MSRKAREMIKQAVDGKNIGEILAQEGGAFSNAVLAADLAETLIAAGETNWDVIVKQIEGKFGELDMADMDWVHNVVAGTLGIDMGPSPLETQLGIGTPEPAMAADAGAGVAPAVPAGFEAKSKLVKLESTAPADHPEYQEYFDYLDELRMSGVTNMFGAGSYLQQEFGLDKRDARDILKSWMDNFSESVREEADFPQGTPKGDEDVGEKPKQDDSGDDHAKKKEDEEEEDAPEFTDGEPPTEEKPDNKGTLEAKDQSPGGNAQLVDAYRRAIRQVFKDLVEENDLQNSIFQAAMDPGQWSPTALVVIHTENSIPNMDYYSMETEFGPITIDTISKWSEIDEIVKEEGWSTFSEPVNAAVIAVWPA
jgi:hypothetical protein